jgi:MFS family permease
MLSWMSGHARPATTSQRHLLFALVAATAIGASGLAAGGNASALLAIDLVGTDAVAGVPMLLLVLGSALGALVLVPLAAAFGRARALSGGYLLGGCGALTTVLAATGGGFVVLLLGSLLLGCANAAVFLTRYAAADIDSGAGRGRALGLTLFGTAIGAVLSPQLLGPSSSLARAIGLPPLSGMFLIATAVFAAAGAALAALPCAAPWSANGPPLRDRVRATAWLAERPSGQVLTPVAILAVTNLLMIGVMVAAPVRLLHRGHGVDAIGLIISLHVAGMLAPSPVTGWLADRLSARGLATFGLALMMNVGLLGVCLPDADAVQSTAILLLLGLGWNCGVVGGSALLVASSPAGGRAWAEALGEIAMSLGAAVAAPLAGVLLVSAGLATVWLSVVLVGAIAFLASIRRAMKGLAAR